MLAVSERTEIVHGRGKMVDVTPVYIALDIDHRAIRVHSSADRGWRRVVSDPPEGSAEEGTSAMRRRSFVSRGSYDR